MNKWQNTTDDIVKELPFHVAEWLLEFGSLTEKLERSTNQKVKLEVLNESSQVASAKEAALLRLTEGSEIWTREVLLFGNGQPWIYAKTLVPKSNAHLIESLGKKPLGSILFSEKELSRQFLKVRRLDNQHHLYQCAEPHLKAPISKLWARRSLWQNSQEQDMALLVSEVFLPESPLY